MNPIKIVLFEDTKGFEEKLLAKIQGVLGRRGAAVLFIPNETKIKDGIYEERLKEELSLSSYNDTSLIVADTDLSQLTRYGGLSEPTVRRVADTSGIPECSYSRGDPDDDLLKKAELREARIAVSLKDLDAFGRSVVSIADGFNTILKMLPNAMKTAGTDSPGKLLAAVLGKPQFADKISLYASGDQSRIASVFKVLADGKKAVRMRHLSCLLGYWLWDSIIRYPGVLVNETAASSYLNIKDTFFRKKEVRSIFSHALYRGPFQVAAGPLWWRGDLDEIIFKSKFKDGRDLVHDFINANVPRSSCCEDPKKQAGYYCMLRKEPVSLENSKNGLAWYPRGADLARISKS